MIRVSHLKNRFQQTVALKDLSVEIKEGEFFGLLGPNGAGKTTTISILSTILLPDEGEVEIAGYNLKTNPLACKQLIGVVPQEIALYNELSAEVNLKFWGSLYGVPERLLEERITQTLQLLGLYERRHEKVKTYSGGMKRRINIASAILHQPRILFMDEPTVGIDPQSRNLIYEVLEQLHRQGMTIVYTTHYMEEAERFCNRIAIIDQGQIIAIGTLKELKAMNNLQETIHIQVDNLQEEGLRKMQQTQPSLLAENNGLQLSTANAQKDLPAFILQYHEAGLQINGVRIQQVNLETLFLNLTGRQLRD